MKGKIMKRKKERKKENIKMLSFKKVQRRKHKKKRDQGTKSCQDKSRNV